jgi:predicted RND superfamily exporter protein
LRGDCADYLECTRRTIDKIGEPMMTTSLILIAGFLCTLVATFKSLWQMGVLCSFTVAVTLIGDFLVTPLLVRFLERAKGAPAFLPDVSLPASDARSKEETT